MENNNAQIEKHQDGSYNVKLNVSLLGALQSMFTGVLNLTLSAAEAADLSTKLYTPKKKYRKPAAKKTAVIKQE